MKQHFPVGTAALFTVFLVLVLVSAIAVKRFVPETPEELVGVLYPAPRALGPMAVTDHTGRLFTLADLDGKWTFVFFGFTHCPDICPTTLAMLKTLVDRVARDVEPGAGPKVVFVSVDPQRDRPETVARYLAGFDEAFVGITADAEKTGALAAQFGAAFFRERETGDDGGYTMAHAGSVYLVGPRARIVASFSPPHDPAVIASQFRRIRELRS